MLGSRVCFLFALLSVCGRGQRAPVPGGGAGLAGFARGDGMPPGDEIWSDMEIGILSQNAHHPVTSYMDQLNGKSVGAIHAKLLQMGYGPHPEDINAGNEDSAEVRIHNLEKGIAQTFDDDEAEDRAEDAMMQNAFGPNSPNMFGDGMNSEPPMMYPPMPGQFPTPPPIGTIVPPDMPNMNMGPPIGTIVPPDMPDMAGQPMDQPHFHPETDFALHETSMNRQRLNDLEGRLYQETGHLHNRIDNAQRGIHHNTANAYHLENRLNQDVYHLHERTNHLQNDVHYNAQNVHHLQGMMNDEVNHLHESMNRRLNQQETFRNQDMQALHQAITSQGEAMASVARLEAEALLAERQFQALDAPQEDRSGSVSEEMMNTLRRERRADMDQLTSERHADVDRLAHELHGRVDKLEQRIPTEDPAVVAAERRLREMEAEARRAEEEMRRFEDEERRRAEEEAMRYEKEAQQAELELQHQDTHGRIDNNARGLDEVHNRMDQEIHELHNRMDNELGHVYDDLHRTKRQGNRRTDRKLAEHISEWHYKVHPECESVCPRDECRDLRVDGGKEACAPCNECHMGLKEAFKENNPLEPGSVAHDTMMRTVDAMGNSVLDATRAERFEALSDQSRRMGEELSNARLDMHEHVKGAVAEGVARGLDEQLQPRIDGAVDQAIAGAAEGISAAMEQKMDAELNAQLTEAREEMQQIVADIEARFETERVDREAQVSAQSERLLREREELSQLLDQARGEREQDRAAYEQREQQWVEAMEALKQKSDVDEQQAEDKKQTMTKGATHKLVQKIEKRLLRRFGINKRWVRRIRQNLASSYVYKKHEKAHPLHHEFNSNPALNA